MRSCTKVGVFGKRVAGAWIRSFRKSIQNLVSGNVKLIDFDAKELKKADDVSLLQLLCIEVNELDVAAQGTCKKDLA